MRVYFVGFPGHVGGANTEALHTIRLWRRFGAEVHVIPTDGVNGRIQQELVLAGVLVHLIDVRNSAAVRAVVNNYGVAPAVGMCNESYMRTAAPVLRDLGCPIVWVNCMTFLFDHEKRFFDKHGPADAMVYQSEFQRSELEPQLKRYGYDPSTGHLLRGAFDFTDWSFAPRLHSHDSPFVVGRVARGDADKWSSNTWPIYSRIQYRRTQAVMLGVSEGVAAKIGPAPTWATCYAPGAMPVKQFMSQLHCLLPVNGGARENWPRAGLEAMAAGVPIVAQDSWGWREMIEHGTTGFLGRRDEELAHYAAVLAYDEDLRLEMARRARRRLELVLAQPELIWKGWRNVFENVKAREAVMA